jgi:hypothetical protein
MDTRIEIYKDGLWQALQLENDAVIKYNAVINRVGKVASREISHTNTFSLPYIHQNIRVLGLNSFNTSDMARAMNAKYVARYYVEEKLLQEGFVVINNANEGKINVNFIDSALSIIEKWGEVTYEEFLKSDTIEFPTDYQTAIDDLRDVYMPTGSVMSHRPNVGTRGYPIMLFPNNLNQIGDSFNKDLNGDRPDNSFNPYQSRPVFNAKAFLDLITESYGYTPIYDSSVDWDLVEQTYITSDGANQNTEEDASLETELNGVTSSVGGHFRAMSVLQYDYNGNIISYVFRSQTFFLVGQNPYQETWPINQGGFAWPNYMDFNQPGGQNGYNQKPIVYKPNFSNGYGGTVRWTADVPQLALHEWLIEVTVWWRTNGAVNPVKIELTENNIPTGFTLGTEYDLDLVMDKSYFAVIPSGSIYCLGVTLDYHRHGQFNNTEHRLKSMRIEETTVQGDIVAFDEFNQYSGTHNDLSYAASKETLKKILSTILHKEGILMNINNKTKDIKFFNYNHYATQRDNGNLSVWTDMFLEYSPVKYNTDYGNAFGRLNHVSLTDPFKGNIYPISLSNQGELSKYKEFAKNEISDFKDVSNVVGVDNSIVEDWYEYEIDGLGLVEANGTITSVTSKRADQTSQGTITNLPKLANVNYARIPDGVASWYQLVDSAIRIEAEFLLTIDTIRELDLSEPIYVEQLGGYFIIEEIKAYTNNRTPTKVKLIKLIDEIEPKAGNLKNPTLTAAGGSKTPTLGGTKYEIGSYVALSDYSITSGTIKAIQLDAHPDDGGVATGLSFTETVDNTTPQFSVDRATATDDDYFLAAFSETSVTAAQEGWYEVTTELVGTATGIGVVAKPTITSTTSVVYLGDQPAPAPLLTIRVNANLSSDEAIGTMIFDYEMVNYLDDTDISVTCEYQKLTGPNGTAVGSLITDTSLINLAEASGTIEVVFPESDQFYRVIFKTTEADSVSNAFGGFYVI